MVKKRLISVVLMGCMMTTCLPMTANASVNVTTGSAIIKQDLTKDGLESIIKSVKSRITIPKELTEFSYNYNAASSYDIGGWNLNWRDKKYEKAINVQTDESGNIVHYSFDTKRDSYKPEYMQSELVSTAREFIKKVAPDIYDKVEYVGVESQAVYYGTYEYKFQRIENGIKMPDNIILVDVNYRTGEVVSYDSNWLYDCTLPSSKAKISKQEASDIIRKALKMQLSYENSYTTDNNGNTKVKAFLVYSPDESYISVDANTGEVYTTQNEWEKGSFAKEKAGVTEADKSDGSGLTDAEIEEIENLSGIISKETAIKTITDNNKLLLDKNLTLINASLYKRWDSDTNNKKSKYYWNITMSDPREVDYNSNDLYRAYAYASVDAETGKLISFRASVKGLYDMSDKEISKVKVKYSKEEGQTIFEEFAKSQIPDLMKNSVLSDNQGSYIIGYKEDKEIYGGYYYNYERVNEGIKYRYNTIQGAVDGVTGKIYTFSYNWDDNITFESPKNVISANKAFDCYIASGGFDKVYEINIVHSIQDDSLAEAVIMGTYTQTPEIRLVYRTDIYPSWISPFTGKQINHDGEEYKKNENVYSYSDINGHKSARNIKLLADIGIGFKGGQFLPDQEIKGKELYEFFSAAGFYMIDSDMEIRNSNSAVSRIEVAKDVIHMLGYDKIAKKKGIFSLNFADNDKISDDNAGYAALAVGLNLLDCNENNEFEPNRNLTRAEAADLIIALLSE